jgi:DNA-binding winged helix-turn-helix (wHTH) protein
MADHERERILSRVSGTCKGPNHDQVLPPVPMALTFSSSGEVGVGCPLFVPAQEACKAGGEICLWRRRVESELEDVDSILRCVTPAGELVFNAELGKIVQAPHLPEGHDPVSITRVGSRMLTSLMQRQGKVLTVGELAQIGGGWKTPAEKNPHNVVVQISHIRRSLGETRTTPNPVLETVKAIKTGYRISTG